MEDRKNEIKALWQAHETTSYKKYLGLPTLVKKIKDAAFSKIKRRMWQKSKDGKISSFTRGEGSSHKSSGTINTYLFNELFQILQNFL